MTTPTSNPSPHWFTDAEHRVRTRPLGSTFTCADIMAEQRRANIVLPAERRAYGGLMLKLKGEGIVEKRGVISTGARSHTGNTTLWIRTDPSPPLPPSSPSPPTAA